MRYLFPLSILLLALLSFVWKSNTSSTEKGEFIDHRDGQVYTWRRMKDGQKWMDTNLNFKMDSSFCYQNEDSICRRSGRLYTWEAALEACPDGWHLPSDQEWWDLFAIDGMAANWWGRQPRNDENGAGAAVFDSLVVGENAFIDLHGGLRRNKLVRSFGIDFISLRNAYFWTATSGKPDQQKAWYYSATADYQLISRNFGWKVFAYSCRCVADE